MFLININDISFGWNINYGILSIPDIENVSICNIEKHDFSACHKDKFFISGIYKCMVVYI